MTSLSGVEALIVSHLNVSISLQLVLTPSPFPDGVTGPWLVVGDDRGGVSLEQEERTGAE